MQSAFGRAPHLLRGPVLARRHGFSLPWLTEAGGRAATAAWAADAAGEPVSPATRLAWARGQRYLGVGTKALGRIAAGENTAIGHPLLDEGLWGAMATVAGRLGYADRPEGMRALFGDLLPTTVLGRQDKAVFDQAFCGPHAREAAARYDGASAPPELVDPAALRAHWADSAQPYPQSLLLLQAALQRELDLRPVVTAARPGHTLIQDV
jgi:hypothetical protein